MPGRYLLTVSAKSESEVVTKKVLLDVVAK